MSIRSCEYATIEWEIGVVAFRVGHFIDTCRRNDLQTLFGFSERFKFQHIKNSGFRGESKKQNVCYTLDRVDCDHRDINLLRLLLKPLSLFILTA